MSKHETWRTREYWNGIGGLLIEEFLVVNGTQEQGLRKMDGLIVLGEEKAIHSGNYFDIKGKDVIVIQTKRNRLGMSLLGQAYFSKLLVAEHSPHSVKSVAICGKNDPVLAKLAAEHDIEVVVIGEDEKQDIGSKT